MERRPTSRLRPRKPETEHRVAFPGSVVAYRHGQGPTASDHHDQPPPPGDGGVQQVALQHGVMLRQDWNHHRGKLAPLGPVYGHCEGGLQFVQFREVIVQAGFLEVHRDPSGGVVHPVAQPRSPLNTSLGAQFLYTIDSAALQLLTSESRQIGE